MSTKDVSIGGGSSKEVEMEVFHEWDGIDQQISAILCSHGITLPIILSGISHGIELLATLQILQGTETGVPMLNKIGELLKNPNSEFAKNITFLKLSTETGPNAGSLLELIDGVLTINLNFEEIKNAKDSYLVQDEKGQLRFVFVTNPSPVTLGHESGHGIQMLSLGTAELNQALQQEYDDKIMNSLGNHVLKIVESLISENVKDFASVIKQSFSSPEAVSYWLVSLRENLKLEAIKSDLEPIKSDLEAIRQAYTFLLAIWNGGEYAELFNILPKIGVADGGIKWSDGQLLNEVEQLRSTENTDFMPSYFEIGDQKSEPIPSLGMGSAFKAANTVPVRFGHRPHWIEKFNDYSPQTKAYVWKFMPILLKEFDVNVHQLPVVPNLQRNFSQGKPPAPRKFSLSKGPKSNINQLSVYMPPMSYFPGSSSSASDDSSDSSNSLSSTSSSSSDDSSYSSSSVSLPNFSIFSSPSSFASHDFFPLPNFHNPSVFSSFSNSLHLSSSSSSSSPSSSSFISSSSLNLSRGSSSESFTQMGSGVPQTGQMLTTQWGNFTVKNVANDGNCLFSSIAEFVGETQEDVREKLNAVGTAWGGDDHAQMAAQVYRRPVYIVESSESGNAAITHAYAATTGDFVVTADHRIPENAIVLHFYSRDGSDINQTHRHFQALLRQNKN